MLYVGIDLGTSAVKLLLMDASGKIEKIVSREYPLSFPHPGWSEQNPEDGMTSLWTASENCWQTVISRRWPVSALAARCTDW